jgi:hypothetical protein
MNTRFHIAHIIPHPKLHGLHGYREVIETLHWGLTSLGYEVTTALNAIANDATNIVLGFQMLSESDVSRLPPDTILYNLEQIAGLSDDQLKPVFRSAARRLRVWEYSERNLAAWLRLQPVHQVVHVPIGWAPVLAKISPAEHQDIDVLHYGLPSDFRFAMFNALCQQGMSCVYACGLYGASRDSLIARSKLVLNLNMYSQSRIFEVVRVSFLLSNAKAVVADLYPDTFIEADLRDAVAFAAPEKIAGCCQLLLDDESARRQLERKGEETMRRRDIRPILTHALATTDGSAH